MSTKVSTTSDPAYATLERLIAARIATIDGPLYTTDAEGLFDAYLKGIPGESGYGICNCGADRTGPSAEAHTPTCPATKLIHSGQRKHYDCSACKRFIEKYGGLVTLDENGRTHSPLWENEVPEFFMNSFTEMSWRVRKARVTGVFYSSELIWGTPTTGEWTHLSGRCARYFSNPLINAHQKMAEKKEEHGMLCRALAEIPREAVFQAVRVLEADAVDRSEKTLGVAKWFLELHDKLVAFKIKADEPTWAGDKQNKWSNTVWQTVAAAPPGWCHIRSTMIGTLLDDIIAGLPYEAICKRWADKMHQGVRNDSA